MSDYEGPSRYPMRGYGAKAAWYRKQERGTSLLFGLALFVFGVAVGWFGAVIAMVQHGFSR